MYCKHCGNKVEDEAVVCVKCGCIVDESAFRKVKQKNIDNDYYSDNIMLWTKVLMIISCIASALFAILSLYLFFYLAINGAIYDYLGVTIDPTPYMFGAIIWSAIAALNICMTYSIFKRFSLHEHITTGFKIVILIFCNLIAGIILLCSNADIVDNSTNNKN